MCAKKKFVTTNPKLPIIKDNWLQNPLDERGLYCNLNEKSERGLKEVLQWQLGKKPHRLEKKVEQFCHTVNFNSHFLQNKSDGVVWLGHASFLLHIDGIRIVIDPIFWGISGLKRKTAMPCHPSEIKDVDVILLSHNHRDHADEKSMKLLCATNPTALILTGLQIGNLLRQWKIQNVIEEAGWYQQYSFRKLNIAYLPAKHWSRRFLWDLNEMLWGSFIIQGKNQSIYFGADSGYDAHFKEVGSLFGTIDIGILGCGAYKPEWFMSTSHKNPAEAVKAFNDTGAKVFIPMHIGTFDLSDEPLSEPFRLLKNYEEELKINGELKILDIGTTLFY